MLPPEDEKTRQGYDMQLGTNNIGPFLFTKLLTPLLVSTAKIAPAETVRVVWVSSQGAEEFCEIGGVDVQNLDYHVEKGAWKKYGISKAGNILQASEMARRVGAEGMISVVGIRHGA